MITTCIPPTAGWGELTVVKVKALPYFLRTRKLELFLTSNHCSSGECVVIAT